MNPKCEVCNEREAVGVCCVPGMPVSAAYCRQCLEANAHPWGYLTAQVSCIGSRAQAAPWVREMINDTCRHLGKTIEEFDEEVKKHNEKYGELLDAYYRGDAV